MTVSIIGGQLKIALTETEITKYNIDRVFFDKAGDDSGKALVYLLELASVMVGFKPNTSLREGLRRFAEWYARYYNN